MKSNNGDGASFFKIFLIDSEYLPLPSAFAEKYLEKGKRMKQNVFLQTKSGVKWAVKYLKIEDRYYFMDGWLKFQKENHLEIGDFLVFWLHSDRHPNPTFQVFIYGPNGSLKDTTRRSGKLVSPVIPTLVHCSDETGCDVKEETSDSVSSDNAQRPFTLCKVMKTSYKHYMPLTPDFVEAAGITGYGDLRLENKDGKMWNVGLRKSGLKKPLPRIVNGWRKFVKDNNVKVGNRCSISHVKDDVLRVEVLRW